MTHVPNLCTCGPLAVELRLGAWCDECQPSEEAEREVLLKQGEKSEAEVCLEAREYAAELRMDTEREYR